MFDSTDRFPTQLADITVSGFSASASLGIRCLNNKVINDRNNNVSFTFLFKEKEQSAGFLGWYVNNLEYGTKEFLVDVPMFGIMKTWRCVFTTKLAENVVSTEVRKISMTARILDDLTTVRNVYNSLLSMPLINSLEMIKGSGAATFTRASTATYIENGVLKYAAIDEPRFEKDGILIETSSTNIHLYSSKITSSEYSVENDGVITEDYESIDGNNNAALLSSSVDGDTYFYAYRSNTLSVGDVYTVSFFINMEKMTSGTQARIFAHTTVTGADTNSYVYLTTDGVFGVIDQADVITNHDVEHIVNSWYRIQLTTTVADINGDGSDVTSNYYSLIEVAGATTLGDGVIFCFPQLENRPFSTSVIPTLDTSKTRAHEYTKLPIENMYDVYKSGSVFFDVTVNAALLNAWATLFRVRGYKNYYIFYRNNSFLYKVDDISSVIVATFEIGRKYKIGFTQEHTSDGYLIKFYVDGVKVYEKLHASISAENEEYKYIQIGDTDSFCHIKDIKVFRETLTDKEVKLL